MRGPIVFRFRHRFGISPSDTTADLLTEALYEALKELEAQVIALAVKRRTKTNQDSPA